MNQNNLLPTLSAKLSWTLDEVKLFCLLVGFRWWGVGSKLSYFHKIIESCSEISPCFLPLSPSPFSHVYQPNIYWTCCQALCPRRTEPTLLRCPGEGEIKPGQLSSKTDSKTSYTWLQTASLAPVPQTRPRWSPHTQPQSEILPRYTFPPQSLMFCKENSKYECACISSLFGRGSLECWTYGLLWIRTDAYWEWTQANYTAQNTNGWLLCLKAYHELSWQSCPLTCGHKQIHSIRAYDVLISVGLMHRYLLN